MSELTRYEQKNTIVHRLNPLTKVLYALIIICAPIILGGWWARIACIALSIIALCIARMFRKSLPMVGMVGFILLTVVIIQSLFSVNNRTVMLAMGSIKVYREGFLYAMRIVCNVLNIVLAIAVLVLTTNPSDLAEAFTRKGVSPKFGYILASVFQVIPQMKNSLTTIQDAQRSRGMETEGKLWVRVRAFFPQITPVIMNSLLATKERAIALEVRGFESKEKRSFIREQPNTRVDTVVRMGLAALLLLALMGRAIQWL